MGGDVYQWNEADYSNAYGMHRGYRGGSFGDPSSLMDTAAFEYGDPATETDWLGFRVASSVPIPEPGSLALLLAGAGGLLAFAAESAASVRAVCAGVLAMLAAYSAQAAAVQYTVTDLGMLPGYTYGSFAQGINDSGQVVGWCQNSSGYSHAFLYSGGTMQDLGTFGGPNSYAFRINGSGQVVGYSNYSSVYHYAEHAFLYSGGTMQDLGTLPGDTVSTGNGINDSGQVVGRSYVANTGSPRAYLYSGGTMKDLGTLAGDTWSNARAINNSGQVIGDSGENIEYSYNHAFLYSGGTMEYLGTLPGDEWSQAIGINDSGQVVGTSYGTGYHAFLYSGGTMQDLNNLVSPSLGGWTLEYATDINDRGQVCGYGINPSGQTDAFLLTPTPEPSSLALLGAASTIGLIGCGLRRRVARTVKPVPLDQDAPAILAFPSHSSVNGARRAA